MMTQKKIRKRALNKTSLDHISKKMMTKWKYRRIKTPNHKRRKKLRKLLIKNHTITILIIKSKRKVLLFKILPLKIRNNQHKIKKKDNFRSN